MSNIDRTRSPNGIDLTIGPGNGSIGISRAVTPAVSVGAEAALNGNGPQYGASVTGYLFPTSRFTPFGSLRYNFGTGGEVGTFHSVGARAGAEYRINNGFGIGAFVGIDRAVSGRSSQPWGPEVGVSLGFHF